MRWLRLQRRGNQAIYSEIAPLVSCEACRYKIEPGQAAAVVIVPDGPYDFTQVIHDDETCFWVLANGQGLTYEVEDLK